MNKIEIPRKYLEDFIREHFTEYFSDYHEYKVHKGYPNYPNHREFERCMGEIVHKIDEVFGYTDIPGKFVTAQVLIDTAQKFVEFLKSFDDIFNETITYFSNAGCDAPEPVYRISGIRRETIIAFEEFIRMANEEIQSLNMEAYRKEMSEGLDVEKIPIGALWKRLSIKSVTFIIGIIFVLCTSAWKIVHLTYKAKIDSLKERVTELEARTSALFIHNDSLGIKNERLTEINNTLLKKIDSIRMVANSKKIEESILYISPKSLFDGKVLVSATKGKSKPELIFKGIKGVSEEKDGYFITKRREVGVADQFYIMLEDNSIWGVNIISTTTSIDIELLPI